MGNGSLETQTLQESRWAPRETSPPAPSGSRVTELERELRRKDAEIQEREYHLKELREQLSKQTVAIAELTEELQNKVIQLNKLQDVVHLQGEAARASRTKCLLRFSGRPRVGLPPTAGGRRLECPPSPTTEPIGLNKPPNFPLRKQESERTPGKMFPSFWLRMRSCDEMLECYLVSLLSGQECMNLFRFWIEGLRKWFALQQSLP